MAHGNNLAYQSRPSDLLQNLVHDNSVNSMLKQGQILVKQTYWDYDDFMNQNITNPPKKCYYKVMSKEEFCKRLEISKDLEQKRQRILKQIGDTSCNEMQKNLAFEGAAACIEDISDDELSPIEDGECEGKIKSGLGLQMIPPQALEKQFSRQRSQSPVRSYSKSVQNQQNSSVYQLSGVPNVPFQQLQQPQQTQQSTNPMPPPLPQLLKQPPRPRKCNITKREMMPHSEFQSEKNNQHLKEMGLKQVPNIDNRFSLSPCRVRGGEEGFYSSGAVADNLPCNCSRSAESRPQDIAETSSAQGRDACQLRYPTLIDKILRIDSSRQHSASSCVKEFHENNFTTQFNSPQLEIKSNDSQYNCKSDSGCSGLEQQQSPPINKNINPMEKTPLNKRSPCREPNTKKIIQPLQQKTGPSITLASSLQNQQSDQYVPFQQNQPNKQPFYQPADYSTLSNSRCSPSKVNNIPERPIPNRSQSRSPIRTAGVPRCQSPSPTFCEKLRGTFITRNLQSSSGSTKCCSTPTQQSNECCDITWRNADSSNTTPNATECCEDALSIGDKLCADKTFVLSKHYESSTTQPEKCDDPTLQNKLSSTPSAECCRGQVEWNIRPSPLHPMTNRYLSSSTLNRPPHSAPTPSGKSSAEVSPQSYCDADPDNQCFSSAPNQQTLTYSPINFQALGVWEQSDCDDQSQCTPCQCEDQSGTDYPTCEEGDCDGDDSDEDYCCKNNFIDQEGCNIFDECHNLGQGGQSKVKGNDDIHRSEDNSNDALKCTKEIQTSCNQQSSIPECSNDKVQIIIQIPQQFSKSPQSYSHQPVQVQMKSCQPHSQPYCLPSENCPQPSPLDCPPSELCQPLSQKIPRSSPSSPHQMPFQPDPLICQPPPSQLYHHLQSQPPCQSPSPLLPSDPYLLQSQPCSVSSPDCLRPLQPPSKSHQAPLKSYSPPPQSPLFQPCQPILPPFQTNQLQLPQPYNYQSQLYQLQPQPSQPLSPPFQFHEQQLQHCHVHKPRPLPFDKSKFQPESFHQTDELGTATRLSGCPSAQQTSSLPFVAFQGIDNSSNPVKLSEQSSVAGSYWLPVETPTDTSQKIEISQSTIDSSGNNRFVPRMLSVGHEGYTSPMRNPLNPSNYRGQQQQFSSFPLDNTGKVSFPYSGLSRRRERIQTKAYQQSIADPLSLKSAYGNCNATMNRLQNQCCNAIDRNFCSGCDGSIR